MNTLYSKFPSSDLNGIKHFSHCPSMIHLKNHLIILNRLNRDIFIAVNLRTSKFKTN